MGEGRADAREQALQNQQRRSRNARAHIGTNGSRKFSLGRNDG
jgi:hypothetical protein